MIKTMESNFSVQLSHFIYDMIDDDAMLYKKVSKLYLIHMMLEFETINDLAKKYCKLYLLHYHNQPIVEDIAKRFYNMYFDKEYTTDLDVDFEEVD
jgi:hypothetical protein